MDNELQKERPHSGISHSIDTGLAKKYGLECAFLINHFAHWIEYNRSLGRNFKEGRTWTYQTRKELAAHFPYLNEEQVRYFTDKLVDEGVLIKGNFNKSGFDKTLWYAFKDEKMFTIGKIPNGDGKIPNGDGKIPKPIPHTKTDTKQKEVSVAAEPLQKISVQINKTEKVALSSTDLFLRAASEKRDWTLEEIGNAWNILSDYGGIVWDWWRFIEGTIDNIRRKIKSENIIGENKWKNKEKKKSKKPLLEYLENDTEKVASHTLVPLSKYLKF